jgi:hypothetical protein
VDDRVGPGEDVVHLAGVGEVGHDELVLGVPVRDEVGVEHVMAVLPEISNGPAAGLAAAAGDDDPHPWGNP